jgi:hypothetical protein
MRKIARLGTFGRRATAWELGIVGGVRGVFENSIVVGSNEVRLCSAR